MLTLFTESENNEEPPERDSDPSGDGSPERSPTPRGISANQAELVSDDTEAYEDPQTGVSVSYVLKEQEVNDCLKKIGVIRGRKRKSAAFVILPAIAAVLSLFAGIWTRQQVLMVVSLAMCAVFGGEFKNYIPPKTSPMAQKIADGHLVQMKIYPDRIEAQGSASRMEIPLDGTSECVCLQDTIALFLPNENKPDVKVPRLIILPLRSIDEGVLPYVEAMIFAGTKPKQTRKA